MRCTPRTWLFVVVCCSVSFVVYWSFWNTSKATRSTAGSDGRVELGEAKIWDQDTGIVADQSESTEAANIKIVEHKKKSTNDEHLREDDSDLENKYQRVEYQCKSTVEVDSDIDTFDAFREMHNHSSNFLNFGFHQLSYSKADVQSQPKLKVFVVPHSHADPGWLKTYKQYTTDTNMILDAAFKFLVQRSDMTFIWTEISFFQRWWTRLDKNSKRRAKKLIDDGQLEILGGAWVMTDEANPHFWNTIDNMIEGHQFLKREIGQIPTVSWSNDPFGYGPTVPFLFSKSGIKQLVINRIHTNYKQHFGTRKQLEFFWRQRWDSEKKDDVFTKVLPFGHYDVINTCGPDPVVCCQYDFKRLTHYACPGPKPVSITNNNVAEKAKELANQYRLMAQTTKHNTALIMLGDDFRYDSVVEFGQQYDNYVKLFAELNSNQDLNMEIKFGTIGGYLKATRSRAESWDDSEFPSLTGDFFPYTENNNDYWTGYFTTRPFVKRMDRLCRSHIRAADILISMAAVRKSLSKQQKIALNAQVVALSQARRDLALFQHHDAITGTSKIHVMQNYAQRLFRSLKYANEAISGATQVIMTETSSNMPTSRADAWKYVRTPQEPDGDEMAQFGNQELPSGSNHVVEENQPPNEPQRRKKREFQYNNQRPGQSRVKTRGQRLKLMPQSVVNDQQPSNEMEQIPDLNKGQFYDKNLNVPAPQQSSLNRETEPQEQIQQQPGELPPSGQNVAAGLAKADKREEKVVIGQNLNFMFVPVENQPEWNKLPTKYFFNLAQGDEKSLFVYNSLPYIRTEVIRVHVQDGEVRVLDPNGVPLAGQLNPIINYNGVIEENGLELVFAAKLNGLSITQFKLTRSQKFNSHKKLPYAKIRYHDSNKKRNEVPRVNRQFVVKQLTPNTFNVKAGKTGAVFSTDTGLLKGVVEGDSSQFSPLSIEFWGYTNTQSGAYVFHPYKKPEKIQMGNESLTVVFEGNVVSDVHAITTRIHHTLTLRHGKTQQNACLFDMRNYVDLSEVPNLELVMRVASDIENNNTFYTDMNGYQMLRRDSNQQGSRMEEDYFPMPAAAFLEDRTKRLSVFGHESHGVSSVAEGTLEIMLDRILSVDDYKGIGYDDLVRDNLPVNLDFKMIVQRFAPNKGGQNSGEKRYSKKHLQKLGFLSPYGFQAMQMLQDPVITMHTVDRTEDIHNGFVPLLRKAFACDLQLVNTRYLGKNIDSEKLLILHKPQLDCRFSNVLASCQSDGDQSSVEMFLDSIGSSRLVQTSLTGIFDEDNSKSQSLNGANIYSTIKPMDISAYKVIR